MTLATRLAALELRAAPPARPLRFLWLDWRDNAAAVVLDGVTYTRTADETDEQLAQRAIGAAEAAYPGDRLMVFSWAACA
jgi:hypothetical protein